MTMATPPNTRKKCPFHLNKLEDYPKKEFNKDKFK